MQPIKIQQWFDSRGDSRAAFLAEAGWADAVLSPVGEDCAYRRYFRAGKDGRTAILMESVPDGSAIATPGHNMKDFIRIGAYLRAAGLNTPEIYEADSENGYVLLEDFGDVSFKTALEKGRPQEDLYGLAADILSFIKDNAGQGISLPHYYESHVHKGLIRLVDWYLPAVRGEKNPDGLAAEYLAVWRRIEQSLPPCPEGFLHVDFHVENMMWLPDRKGPARCGILDFQGAMKGPLPYDLANLLEDARVYVPPDLRRAMLERYCAGMNQEEKEIFESWYRILATQFHCRVAGQFIRLAVKDGKDRYLAHLPRVAGYLKEGLGHPSLEPLHGWLSGLQIDFEKLPAFNPGKIREWAGSEAF